MLRKQQKGIFMFKAFYVFKIFFVFEFFSDEYIFSVKIYNDKQSNTQDEHFDELMKMY